MSNLEAVGLGALNMDYIYQVERIIGDRETAERMPEYIVESGNKNIISALDTTGAGDAFATGFLYGLLKGKGLRECGLLGDIVARLALTKFGTRQGLPRFKELAQRYRELHNLRL